ncbi:hypothetical protein EV182_003604, partial [Spiromyces aspiralis]
MLSADTTTPGPASDLDIRIVNIYGLRFDRQWMIIDHNNKLVTQRTMPKLVFVKPQLIFNDPNDPRSN